MVAVRMSVTSGMLRSSAFWQSSSTLITPPDKASRRLFETRSSRKSGTRLSASIKELRPPASRRRDQLRRPDRAISAAPCGLAITPTPAGMAGSGGERFCRLQDAGTAHTSGALARRRRCQAQRKSERWTKIDIAQLQLEQAYHLN